MNSEFAAATKFIRFFRNHWFKLTLVAFALYIFFKKELSFQVRMQTPEKTEQKTSRKPPEKWTEKSAPLAGNSEAHLDKMEMPFIGGKQNEPGSPGELAAIDEQTKQAYLQRFAKVAVAEQKKFGIPASLILAAALHQSAAGKRDLTLEGHSHFALPCTKDWNGKQADFQGKCYRIYGNAWESFRDFSNFCTTYFPNLKGGNHEKWAKELGRSGFSGDDDFAENVVKIIESYRLKELDNL
ncbi:MAG: glucosaminidase domain-containing protein [Bacteroidota bacterium]